MICRQEHGVGMPSLQCFWQLALLSDMQVAGCHLWEPVSLSCCPRRLVQLHIIRRPWMEDSKVLKSQIVMAPSMPVVQNLRQSCLSTS